MNEHFLAVNKDFLGKGLKPLDMLILSQIEEFIRNTCECYITNEQFANMFGVTAPTVDKSLQRLESQGVIYRNTKTVTGNGRANNMRILGLKKGYRELINGNKGISASPNGSKENYDGNKVSCDGSKENSEWQLKNLIIKNKIKDNKKDKEDMNRENNMFDNDFVYKIEDMPTLLDDYGIDVYDEDPAEVYDYFVDNIMINYDDGCSVDEIAVDFEWPVGFVQAVVNYYGL